MKRLSKCLLALSLTMSAYAGRECNGGGAFYELHPGLDHKISAEFSSKLNIEHSLESDSAGLNLKICDDKRKYFEIPKDMKVFNLKIKSKDQLVNVDHSKLCSNDKILHAYNSFTEATFLSNEKKAFLKRILKNTENFTDKIEMVLEEDGRLEKTFTGEEYNEFTWFDLKTNLIHWASPRRTNLNQGESKRTLDGLLRHELTHYIMAKTYKNYPEVKLFHAKPRNDLYLFDVQSNELSAFFEAIAFVVEYNMGISSMTLSRDHIYVADKRSIQNFDLWGEGSQHQYVDPAKIDSTKYRFSKYFDSEDVLDSIVNDPSILKKNESYISSLMANLFTEYYKKPVTSVNDVYKTWTNYKTFNLEKLFSILIKSQPNDLVSFVEAYNQETNSKLGTKWFYEFFHYDLDEKRDVTSDMEQYKNRLYLDFSHHSKLYFYEMGRIQNEKNIKYKKDLYKLMDPAFNLKLQKIISQDVEEKINKVSLEIGMSIKSLEEKLLKKEKHSGQNKNLEKIFKSILRKFIVKPRAISNLLKEKNLPQKFKQYTAKEQVEFTTMIFQEFLERKKEVNAATMDLERLIENPIEYFNRIKNELIIEKSLLNEVVRKNGKVDSQTKDELISYFRRNSSDKNSSIRRLKIDLKSLSEFLNLKLL